MASERSSPGFADYVVTALSPVLIMLMVGSLVFFLVEVLYGGRYTDRLLYTLFFFVLAAVLVARISIQYDAGRAAIYGVALAIATYLALLAYVEYPAGWLRSWGWLVNLGLMAVVWFSAHKLTWDCTYIDEERESSGQGLLSAAGLDADDKKEPGDAKQEPEKTGQRAEDRGQKAEGKKKKKKTKKAKYDSRLWDWIERYKAHREAERKAGHTPGVWVLYFALAALPLFALGQSLIDPGDSARRRATFIQMAVYIASALGLLVTTSLLGVRRYLRQRKAKIPIAMTATWLLLGGLLIAVFLAAGAFLPRPHSEVPWFGIQRAGNADRNASNYAQVGDSTGKGEGRGGKQSKEGKGSTSGKGGEPGGGNQGTKGNNGGEGKGEGGKEDANSKGEQSGKNKGNGKSQGSESKADKSEQSGSRSGDEKTEREGDEAKEKGSGRDRESGSSPPLNGVLDKVAGVVKWIVYAIVAVLVVFGLFFGVLKYLAPFTDWARRWLEGIRAFWANLFNRGTAQRAQASAAEDEPPLPQRPPPFHAYSNPFADGTAEGRDPAELIAYTFEALDAWAWDRDAGRKPMETPMEFARRLGEAFPGHAEIFMRLATLYTRMAYSTLPLPGNTLGVLEQAWEQMVHGAVAEV